MNWIKTVAYATLISALLITSCNLPSEETAKATQTALFETVVAGITQTIAAKPTETATMQPTMTLPVIPPTTNPLLIPTVPPSVPTVAVTPCNRATFIADVTVPDGSVIAPGSSFKKTWRLQNSGTCTWTSGYTVVYVAGERMGAPESEVITTSSVAPGQSLDVSVTLTAPAAVGSYIGYFRLRSADGIQFGVLTNAAGTFYVQIKVTGATATSTNAPTQTPTVTATPTNITVPPPSISGVSPNPINITIENTIVVSGSNFINGAAILLDSNELETNFTPASELNSLISANSLQSGPHTIIVKNPDGQTSGSYQITAQ